MKKLHVDDISKGLEFLGNWLIDIAQTENNEIKRNILIKVSETFIPFNIFDKLNQIYPNFTVTTPITEKLSLMNCLYMKLKLNHFNGRNGRNRVKMFRPKTSLKSK